MAEFHGDPFDFTVVPRLTVLLGALLLVLPYLPACSTTPAQTSGQGPALPIFRLDDNHWFELSIPAQKHPKNAIELQEQINRQQQADNAEKRGDSELFPDELDFLNDIQLRYRLRFK